MDETEENNKNKDKNKSQPTVTDTRIFGSATLENINNPDARERIIDEETTYDTIDELENDTCYNMKPVASVNVLNSIIATNTLTESRGFNSSCYEGPVIKRPFQYLKSGDLTAYADDGMAYNDIFFAEDSRLILHIKSEPLVVTPNSIGDLSADEKINNAKELFDYYEADGLITTAG